MCDHPIEQACECETKAAYHSGADDHYGAWRDVLRAMLARLRSVRDWGSHALIDAQMEMREEQTRHRKAAVDRDDLHSELVQLRLAYAAIEEERNRLAGENRRLTETQDRVEEFARDLERKGKECRELATDPKRLDTRDNRARLRDKASTYEAEARSLRQILESA